MTAERPETTPRSLDEGAYQQMPGLYLIKTDGSNVQALLAHKVPGHTGSVINIPAPYYTSKYYGKLHRDAPAQLVLPLTDTRVPKEKCTGIRKREKIIIAPAQWPQR